MSKRPFYILTFLLLIFSNSCQTSKGFEQINDPNEEIENFLRQNGYLEVLWSPELADEEIYLLIHPEDHLEYSNYISFGMNLKLPVGINIALYYMEKPNEQYPSRPNFMACHYMKTENGWRYFIKFNFLREYNYISEFTDYDTKQKISMKVYY